jgi:Fic family protein
VENADEMLFSHAKMENRYGVSDEKISAVINELLDKKYIEQSGSKFKIIGTPWD